MKKCFAFRWVNKLFALPIVACLFVSCSQDAVQEEIVPDPDPIVSMTDPELLEYLGYDPEEATEYELYYTVGDEIVSKERLDEIRREPQTRMQQDPNYGLVNRENQTVYLQDQYADLMTESLRGAVEEYNKLNSNLRFVIDNSHYKAVRIECGDDGYGSGTTYISVERPNNKGEYGKYARVNFTSYRKWATDYYEGKFAMMHVLGHLVGFNHAVPDFVMDPYPGWVSGTAYYDSESIMRPEKDIVNGLGRWNGFSQLDIEAIEFIFPIKDPDPDPGKMPEIKITCTPAPTGKSGTTLKLGVDYEIQAVYTYSKCPDPRYRFSITSPNGSAADYTRTDLDNGKIRLRFAQTGLYGVTATVLNATEQNTQTVTYNLPDPRPIITGPSKAELGKFYDFTVTYRNADYPDPTFDLWWDEMVFDTGSATVQRVSANRFRVRFDEPGGFRFVADVQGATGIESGEYYLSVYYKPYWKVEKKSKRFPLNPGIVIPVKPKPLSIMTWNQVIDEFTNTVYFYADEACTQQIPLAHDVLFDYTLCYALTNGERYWCEGGGTGGRLIVPKGETAVVLPQSKKTSVNGMGSDGKTVTTIRDPYFEIIYPQNECTSVNPFD